MIIYILVSAGVVAASYLFGHLALFAGDDDGGGRFAYAFRRLSLGLLLIVTLYAVANCGGVTVLAGVIPLLFFGVRPRMPRPGGIKTPLAAVMLFGGVFAAIAILKYFAGSDLAGNMYLLKFDHSFYAALANYVANSGIESTNIDLMFPALQSPAIYHWFDVHLSAMLGQIAGNYYNARLFITLPLLTATAMLGLAAMIERYCTRAGLRAIPWLACLVFCISYDFGPFTFYDTPEKVYVMVCVIAWTVLSENKALPLVIGSLLVSSAAPALLTGAFITLAIGFAKGRRSKKYWKNVAVLASGGLWFVAFYTLTARENPYFTSYLTIPQQIGQAFSEFSIPTAKKFALSFVVKIAVNFAICLLLFVLLAREDKKRIARLVGENAALFVATVTGLAFACTLWFARDALQLAVEVCMPLAFAGQALLPAMLLTGHRRILAKIVTAAVLIAGVAVIIVCGSDYRGRPVDGDFLRKVAAVEGPVVWIDTNNRRESGDEMVRDPNYIVPFSTVRRLRNDYFPVRLDIYDIAYDPKEMQDYAVLASIENSTFYRWVESNKINLNELRDAQTRFIKENGIHYVITPSGDPWMRGRGFRIEERTMLESRGYTLYRISYDEDPVQ